MAVLVYTSNCDTCASSFSLCFCVLFLRFGRHPVLIISVLFMLVFGLSVAFSVNVTVFSTLRFFEGFCLAGLALSLYVLSKYPYSLPPSCLLSDSPLSPIGPLFNVYEDMNACIISKRCLFFAVFSKSFEKISQ